MVITFTEHILGILLEFVVDLNDPLLSLVHRIENLMIDANKKTYTYFVKGRELTRILDVMAQCLSNDWLSKKDQYELRNMAKKNKREE